jgi:hypothetical protein
MMVSGTACTVLRLTDRAWPRSISPPRPCPGRRRVASLIGSRPGPAAPRSGRSPIVARSPSGSVSRSAFSRIASSILSDAVRGRPCGRPSFRAWAIPARTRSRKISRSNSAKIASIPAMARPDGVVRSRASVSEIKPTPRSVNSPRVVIRSATDRPQRSSRQTTITSTSRRRAAISNDSRPGRSLEPEPMSSIDFATFQPRFLM